MLVFFLLHQELIRYFLKMPHFICVFTNHWESSVVLYLSLYKALNLSKDNVLILPKANVLKS